MSRLVSEETCAHYTDNNEASARGDARGEKQCRASPMNQRSLRVKLPFNIGSESINLNLISSNVPHATQVRGRFAGATHSEAL
jgi:hypothetical protein